MSEDSLEIGHRTRDLEDWDHQARTTEKFLNNKTLNPNPPLTVKQRLSRLGAAAAVAAGGIFAYKQGIFNSAESEQKGLLSQENHQTIDNTTDNPSQPK